MKPRFITQRPAPTGQLLIINVTGYDGDALLGWIDADTHYIYTADYATNFKMSEIKGWYPLPTFI